MPSKGEVKQELLIIRRGPAEDLVAAKGGAWKIAYADFVTAMMAFFLVMWLINSANEVTKARVASYFNPIKMTDAAPVKKGLRENVEPNSQKTNVDGQQSGGETSSDAKNGGGQTQLSREELMENPMTALERISEQSENVATQQVEVEVAAGDPFDPKSSGERGQLNSKSAEKHTPAPQPSPPPANQDAVEQQHEIAKAANSEESIPHQAGNLLPAALETDQVGKKTEKGEEVKSLEMESVKQMQIRASDSDGQLTSAESDLETKEMAKAALRAKEKREALELLKEIRTELADLRGAIDINVTVKVTSEGTLVVFEDGKKRSMFAVGSASPNPALVTLLGKVGELLNRRKEPVVIRGHTDGRRFRIETYDNWQLSTDRAHMASYMLIRGGLPESRLMRIEGYGSSQPAVPEDVFADANRRVEFLLARPSP
jgi:chemotaxis protein MotB